MRSMRRSFALLFGAALVAMAFAAPGASAMEVRDADTGELCPEVSPAIDTSNPIGAALLPEDYESGGCTVHVTAVEDETDYGTLMLYSGWEVERPCYLSYDLHIGPDGWGYATNLEFDENWLVGGECGLWRARDTHTILPGDVNPYGFFTAANEATDFNTWLTSEGHGVYGWVGTEGLISLEVDDADPKAITNQYTAWNSFSGGQWEGDAGLLITH